MFAVLDDTIPLEAPRGDDPVLGLARHLGLRPRGWEAVPYGLESRSGRIGHALVELLASRRDLQFIKLSVI